MHCFHERCCCSCCTLKLAGSVWITPGSSHTGFILACRSKGYFHLYTHTNTHRCTVTRMHVQTHSDKTLRAQNKAFAYGGARTRTLWSNKDALLTLPFISSIALECLRMILCHQNKHTDALPRNHTHTNTRRTQQEALHGLRIRLLLVLLPSLLTAHITDGFHSFLPIEQR